MLVRCRKGWVADDAVRYDSLSWRTANPEAGTRDRLIALAGKDAASDDKFVRYSDELAEVSIVEVRGAPGINAAADFYIELSPAMMPTAQFICGNPSLLRAYGSFLAALKTSRNSLVKAPVECG
jgi:hypothetical protein